MNMAFVSVLLTYVIAGAVGWVVSRKFKKPGAIGWVVLVVLTILAQAILPGTRVIAIFQFEMFANHILQGFLAGVLIGLLLRKSK